MRIYEHRFVVTLTTQSGAGPPSGLCEVWFFETDWLVLPAVLLLAGRLKSSS